MAQAGGSAHDLNDTFAYDNRALELGEPIDVPSDTKEVKPHLSTNFQHKTLNLDIGNLQDNQENLEKHINRTEDTGPTYYKNVNKVVSKRGAATAVTSSDVQVIQTAGLNTWRDAERERPLTANRLRLLKVFGIISAMLFFPFGIPAAWFAFKAEKELHKGILKGNIDSAQKCAIRSKNLTIFSWLSVFIVVFLVTGIIQRFRLTEEEHNSVRNGLL